MHIQIAPRKNIQWITTHLFLSSNCRGEFISFHLLDECVAGLEHSSASKSALHLSSFVPCAAPFAKHKCYVKWMKNDDANKMFLIVRTECVFEDPHKLITSEFSRRIDSRHGTNLRPPYNFRWVRTSSTHDYRNGQQPARRRRLHRFETLHRQTELNFIFMSCLPSLVYATNIPNESINMRSFSTGSAHTYTHTLVCCPSLGVLEQEKKCNNIQSMFIARDLCYYFLNSFDFVCWQFSLFYYIRFCEGCRCCVGWVGVDC